MRMVNSLMALVLTSSFLAFVPAWAQSVKPETKATSTIHIKDLNVRDPYILTDERTKTYFLYKSSTVKDKGGKSVSGVVAYKSKDMERWEGPFRVQDTPADNWITGSIWAPEVHHYQGKYYLFATMNSTIEWKKKKEHWPPYTFRGTQIFFASSPLGPFLPFKDKLPHTPMDRMALDGTLWVEDGTPYMIYCHEWVQIADGSMELVALSKDLSKTVGPSVTLFNASSAAWSTGQQGKSAEKSYVTDGCFLYRSKTGKLFMIWSSFKTGSYAIGVAESATGKVTGPWLQKEDTLFGANGGHGMLFKTLEGQLMLVFHGPNSPGGAERAMIYKIEDTGDQLVLKDRLF